MIRWKLLIGFNVERLDCTKAPREKPGTLVGCPVPTPTLYLPNRNDQYM
jgi:hypothetical protein